MIKKTFAAYGDRENQSLPYLKHTKQQRCISDVKKTVPDDPMYLHKEKKKPEIVHMFIRGWDLLILTLSLKGIAQEKTIHYGFPNMTKIIQRPKEGTLEVCCGPHMTL